jgi:hypothetical protein
MELQLVAHHLLEQPVLYLRHLSPAQYSRPLDLLAGASIGQHTRHFLEFFQCLLAQLRAPSRRVDYAARERRLGLEEEPEEALYALRDVQHSLSNLSANCSCRLAYGELVGREAALSSSLERELLYNIEHTIHHLAMVRIGLRLVAPQLELPESFGLAPSTLQYRQQKAK